MSTSRPQGTITPWGTTNLTNVCSSGFSPDNRPRPAPEFHRDAQKSLTRSLYYNILWLSIVLLLFVEFIGRQDAVSPTPSPVLPNLLRPDITMLILADVLGYG